MAMNNDASTLLDAVAARLNLYRDDILCKQRYRNLADARAAYAYLLRVMTDYSLHRIASIIGCRHSTVAAQVDKVEMWLDTPRVNPRLATAVNDIYRKYYPHARQVPRPKRRPKHSKRVTDKRKRHPSAPIFAR